MWLLLMYTYWQQLAKYKSNLVWCWGRIGYTTNGYLPLDVKLYGLGWLTIHTDKLILHKWGFITKYSQQWLLKHTPSRYKVYYERRIPNPYYSGVCVQPDDGQFIVVRKRLSPMGFVEDIIFQGSQMDYDFKHD